MKEKSWTISVIVVGLIVIPALQVRSEVTIETIALTGWQVPDVDAGVVFGGSGITPFEFFMPPRINNSGQIIFQGSLTGTGVNSSNDLAVFTGTSSSNLSMIARQGDPAPGTPVGVVFNSSTLRNTYLAINDTGQFAFIGETSPYYSGLWTGTSPTNVPLFVINGDQAGDMDSGVVYARFRSDSVRLNSEGQIAFGAYVTGPGVVSGENSYGIWIGNSPEGLSLFARTGQTPPGRTDWFTIFPEGGMEFSVNDNGQFVMEDYLTEDGYKGAGTVDTGSLIVTGTSYDDMEIVAVSGQQAPGLPNGIVFDSPSVAAPGINNAGQMVFYFSIEGPGVDLTNNGCLWTGTNSNDLSLLVREGDQALGTEDGVVFSGVGGSSIINKDGLIVVQSGLAGPGVDSTNDSGIWIGTSADDLALIVREGDPMPGVPGEIFGSFMSSFNRLTINDTGQILFQNGTGGSYGIWFYEQGAELRLISRSGDVLEVAPGDFRTVRSGFVWYWIIGESGGQDGTGSSLNNQRQLAFRAMFTDGSAGIFLATLPGPIAGDCDGDGDVDWDDFAEFVEQWLLSRLSWDVVPDEGDGIVNFVDWALFADGWQTTTDGNDLADFVDQWLQYGCYCADIAPAPDGDGIVNMLDFAAFANNWMFGVE